MQHPRQASGAQVNASSDLAFATLSDIDILHELQSRPSRSAQYDREHEGFARLAAALASNSSDVLQKLVDIALTHCSADSVGISLLECDQIRSDAVAGVLASRGGTTLPRRESPSNVCIDRNSTQLMHLPDRCFRSVYADPRAVEMLLVPLHDHDVAVGAVWIASHSPERRFDREDERLVRNLAQYASAGWQLRKMHAEVADTTRRKDRLLAVLGHELRNPLAAITASTAVLQQHVHEPRGSHAVEVIARQARLVERLAGDLLDRSRLLSGKLRLEVVPVDLWKVVADAVETCRPKIEQRRIEVSIGLPHAPAVVDGDPLRLGQLFSNLIDNAAKFTPEGGRVTIGGSLGVEHATVSIHDTGVGIPRDQIQRLFEPYAQLTNPRDTSPATGLGLGLSLVRSLAELHHGIVTVASDGAGAGSCFTVQLPIQADRKPSSLAHAS